MLKNSPGESLRAKRSNPIIKKIKYFEIATSLGLLAMTGSIEFFRNLLGPLFKNLSFQKIEVLGSIETMR